MKYDGKLLDGQQMDLHVTQKLVCAQDAMRNTDFPFQSIVENAVKD